MMVMMTWSNIAKSGNAPLSPGCVNIDLGRFQIKREIYIYGPTKIKINYTEFKVILTYSPSNYKWEGILVMSFAELTNLGIK